MQVVAKFNVTGVKKVNWNKDVRIVELSAIYDTSTPENQRFTKATPVGSMTMQVENPPANQFFEQALETNTPVLLTFKLA